MAGEWNDLNEILSMRKDKEHTPPPSETPSRQREGYMQRPWGRNRMKGERNDWRDPKKDKCPILESRPRLSLLCRCSDFNSHRGPYPGSPCRVRSWHSTNFFVDAQTQWFPRQFGPVSLGPLPRVSVWTSWPRFLAKGQYILFRSKMKAQTQYIEKQQWALNGIYSRTLSYCLGFLHASKRKRYWLLRGDIWTVSYFDWQT